MGLLYLYWVLPVRATKSRSGDFPSLRATDFQFGPYIHDQAAIFLMDVSILFTKFCHSDSQVSIVIHAVINIANEGDKIFRNVRSLLSKIPWRPTSCSHCHYFYPQQSISIQHIDCTTTPFRAHNLLSPVPVNLLDIQQSQRNTALTSCYYASIITKWCDTYFPPTVTSTQLTAADAVLRS
jgi:hypothetical protein